MRARCSADKLPASVVTSWCSGLLLSSGRSRFSEYSALIFRASSDFLSINGFLYRAQPELLASNSGYSTKPKCFTTSGASISYSILCLWLASVTTCPVAPELPAESKSLIFSLDRGFVTFEGRNRPGRARCYRVIGWCGFIFYACLCSPNPCWPQCVGLETSHGEERVRRNYISQP
jgi:hypothetical protein